MSDECTRSRDWTATGTPLHGSSCSRRPRPIVHSAPRLGLLYSIHITGSEQQRYRPVLNVFHYNVYPSQPPARYLQQRALHRGRRRRARSVARCRHRCVSRKGRSARPAVRGAVPSQRHAVERRNESSEGRRRPRARVEGSSCRPVSGER